MIERVLNRGFRFRRNGNVNAMTRFYSSTAWLLAISRMRVAISAPTSRSTCARTGSTSGSKTELYRVRLEGLCLFVFLVFAIVPCSVSGTSTPETEVYRKTSGSDFQGERYGWLVLLDGRVLRTRDGGMRWEKTAAPPIPDNFSRVSFVNSEAGWAVSSRRKIWRSTDGGATWKNVSSLPDASARESYVRQITFIG